MRTVVILQVRSTSTRLPGKALLPVAGFPSSVLAALRAGNKGHEVLVVTSSEASDDALAESFRERGITVVRGPLDDVLTRFALATANLPEDCLVIRLTGDNVVPDGELVEELPILEWNISIKVLLRAGFLMGSVVKRSQWLRCEGRMQLPAALMIGST
jgi:spore coat polysaccharide biosynthesis protein SpsF